MEYSEMASFYSDLIKNDEVAPESTFYLQVKSDIDNLERTYKKNPSYPHPSEHDYKESDPPCVFFNWCSGYAELLLLGSLLNLLKCHKLLSTPRKPSTRSTGSIAYTHLRINPQMSPSWSANQEDLIVRHSSSVIVRRQYGEIEAFFLTIPRSDNRCLRTTRISPASPWTNTSTGPGAKSSPATASGSSTTGSSALRRCSQVMLTSPGVVSASSSSGPSTLTPPRERPVRVPPAMRQ